MFLHKVFLHQKFALGSLMTFILVSSSEPIAAENSFLEALSSNKAWAEQQLCRDPDYFKHLAAGQDPSILWVGCSDSRVPETTILGLQPGDVFVHRNIGNIISATDINTAAIIEFAVNNLSVKHIVLCGHSHCGGATAALSNDNSGGVLDTWLAPLRALRYDNGMELGAGKDLDERVVRLVELNVEAGVKVLMNHWAVREAIRHRGLEVHGCLFNLTSGQVLDLGFGTVASKR